MKATSQKILGWIGMSIGAGGALFLTPIAILVQRRTFVVWAAIYGVAALAFVLVIRAAYRREPSPGAGPFHLRLSDLLVGAFSVASVMLFGQAYANTDTLAVLTLIGAGFGIPLVIGFLLASRHQVPAGWRYVLALGFPFFIHGVLAIGALLAVSAQAAYMDKLEDAFKEILWWNLPTDEPLLLIVFGWLRAGLCCAPVGFALCGLAWRQRPGTGRGPAAEQRAGQDAPRDPCGSARVEP